MFIYVGNTFIGSKVNQKIVCCTLKFWGVAILKLCKLGMFPGSDFGILFFWSTLDPTKTHPAKKAFVVIFLRFRAYFSYIDPTNMLTVHVYSHHSHHTGAIYIFNFLVHSLLYLS